MLPMSASIVLRGIRRFLLATSRPLRVLRGPSLTANVTTVGFGRAFTSPQGVDTLGARVFIATEGDAYTGSSNGFFKIATVYAEAIALATHYRASNSAYNMFLRFNPIGASTVTTNSFNFFVDEINALPAVVTMWRMRSGATK